MKILKDITDYEIEEPIIYSSVPLDTIAININIAYIYTENWIYQWRWDSRSFLQKIPRNPPEIA
jgi:hypothetical protein